MMKRKDASTSPANSPDKKRQRVKQSTQKSIIAGLPGGSSLQNASKAAGSSRRTGIFSGIQAYILQAGLGKARTELFKKQLSTKGASVQSAIDETSSHVIVDEEMTYPRFCRIMKYKEDHVPAHFKFQLVNAKWLSYCLSEGTVVDHENFILSRVGPERQTTKIPTEDASDSPKRLIKSESENLQETGSDCLESDKQRAATSSLIPKQTTLESPAKKPAARNYDSDDSNYVPSGSSDDEDGGHDNDDDDESEDEGLKKKFVSSDGNTSSSNVSTPNLSPTKLPRGNWVCSRPSTSQKTSHNEHITDKLEILMKTYENMKDKWRALGYKKAIMALKNYSKDVTTWEEANAIPGIGTKLADKIWEIIESGHLRKIDHVCKGEDVEAIDLFNNVWGAGPTVAREWVQQGLRTLDDLRDKAKLTKQQQIGLKHYHDLLERMPRNEAGDIERTVREAAESLFPGMLAVVCGSYRRGKQTCGDVDVLITHPDGKSHKGALSKILDALRQTGFITDDLIRVEEKGEHKKYMGVCKLPGDERKHRRIDIIVAPYSEYPCALVHFTGSGHFNRSMRALAKKRGMSLSEHAMRAGVVRSGQEKISKGVVLPVTSEEDIFRHLGLEYRLPQERDY